MGAGSSAFNRRDIKIIFSDEIISEFNNIQKIYFMKENGSFHIDTTILNCKAIPDALNYINYYNYSSEIRIRLYNLVYKIITNI